MLPCWVLVGVPSGDICNAWFLQSTMRACVQMCNKTNEMRKVLGIWLDVVVLGHVLVAADLWLGVVVVECEVALWRFS